jgi:hypothetical protein
MGLGAGKKTVSLTFFLYFLLSVNGQDARSYRYHPDNKQQIRHSITDDGSIVIDYNLPDLSFNETVNGNGTFYRISIPEHGPSSEFGKPELPVYSQLITVPEGSDIRVRITNVRKTRISPASRKIRGMLYPAQESMVKSDLQDKPAFRMDKKAYSSKGFINRDTVKIEYLGKARDKSLANLYISPVGYNPHSNVIELITSMTITVSFTGTKSSKSAAVESAAFDESLSKGVINYNREVIPGFTNKPIGMIILTDTSFKKQLKPFIEWKIQKGFRVNVIYRGSKYAGVSYTQLKDTIEGIYRSGTEEAPPPDYLLIIGDINRIPYYGAGGSGNVTDMYYGEFDGNGDYIPEIYVGRLPVKDTTELKNVISKIIQYEKFDFTATNKFHSSALATAGSDPGFASYMNGQVKYSVTNYFVTENKLTEHHFYYPGDLGKQKDSILKIINNGTSFINYTGHGDASGWLHLNIRVADTVSMKNRNKYPFIVSNACRTAQYNLANSFGNRLVLEKNKGAIGFIGCSNDSYWDEDYYWAVGMGTITENPTYTGKGLGAIDRMFHTHKELPGDWYYTMGQINYAGNLSVSASSSARKKYYWETYNLVGDPSVIPITGTPENFSISLPDTLPNGIKTLSLTAEPFSYVAISHFDTLWDASFAGASGSVTLNMPGLSNDSCLVVITGQNRYPLIRKIRLTEVHDEYLNLTSTIVNDNLGNNNKKADFGESFYLSLALSNLGLDDANDTYVKISSAAQWLTIETDSAYIGILPHQSNINLTDRLKIKVSDNVPDMGISTVNVLLKSRNSEKHYKVDLILHSPDLKIVSYVIDDVLTGNGDHIADPGETFYLVFMVSNQGSSDASGKFNIQSSDAGLSVLESDVQSGILKSAQTSDIALLVRLEDGIASGSFIPIASKLNSFPFTISRDFVLRVGRIRESFEAVSFNIFPWINVSTIPWTITSSNSFEGSMAAKSGAINHNGSSSLVIKTFYPTQDSIKFFCKVSSEPNYDFLSFNLNGREIFKKSGEVPWTKMVVAVPEGLNKMEWIYRKDLSKSEGLDCAWIDMIDFASAGSVRYITKDLNVARIEIPAKKENYGQELVTVKVLNTGKDVINGFNLTFRVNGKSGTREYFDNKILPNGDTVAVTFKGKADLSKYGIYDIVAFGSDNNDDYLLNDTASVKLENTHITESLSVFPNPFSDHLSVVVNSQVEDVISISVTSMSGMNPVMIEKTVVAGQNTFNLNDLNLSPGVYILKVRGRVIEKTVSILRINK